MNKGIIVGGGASPLNFKVVGGTEQPANPRENTIWVDTEHKITSWVISAQEPETPAEGMVWLQTGTESAGAFNALKKNNITVYPLSCEQNIGGVWLSKDAQVYKGGVWTLLIPDGVLFSSKYGGAIVDLHTSSQLNGGITVAETGIVLLKKGTSRSINSVCNANAIDITPYNKFVVEGKFAYEDSDWRGKVVARTSLPNAASDYSNTGWIAYQYLNNTNSQFAIDISAAGGLAYVGVYGVTSGTITEMRLEK